MIRTSLFILLCAAGSTFAQAPSATPPATAGAPTADAPAGSSPASPSETTPPPQEPPAAGRITGIQTNREMIAAEAPTDIVINGNPGIHCGLTVDFGDGASAAVQVSETSPFPIRVAHTYAKTGDPTVRVSGVQTAGTIPCLGAVDAAVHVSPAGSKIEYITLSTGCPEGWQLRGEIRADKSFSCAPVADASAPTNLIHCVDGMKYFAKGGNIGCMHPAAGIPEEPAQVATAKGARGKGGMKAGMGMMGGGMGKHGDMSAHAGPVATAVARTRAAVTKAKKAVASKIKSSPKDVKGSEAPT